MAIEVKDRAEQVDPSRMVLGKNSRQKKKILPRSKKGIAILIIISVSGLMSKAVLEN